MNALDQAANDLTEDFRVRVIQYKAKHKITYNDMEKECELGINTINGFCCGGRTIPMKAMYKIHLATGIAL